MSVELRINKRSTDYSAMTLDPTGFSDPSAVIVTYDKTTRKVTLTGTVVAYWRGRIVTELISGWVSAAHADTAGTWFLYYDGSSFTWATTVWSFSDLQIAYVEYHATAANRYALRECHGASMPWNDHMEFHLTLGTYRSAGGDFSGYVLASTTAADRRPLIGSTTIHDEDVPTVVPALSTEIYTQFYLSSTSTANYVVDAADIVPVLAARPYYNQFTGGAWTQTLLPNNAYAAVWTIAVPVTADANSQKFRYLWVQPQSQSTTLTTVQALQTTDVNLGELNDTVPEFVFIEKTIIRYAGGNWTLISTETLNGTRRMQVANVAGFYLSAVEHDTTLTGDGTVGSPLGLSGTDQAGKTLANLDDAFVTALLFG